MPANVSQNIFDKTRLFRRLQFQRGKPVGDYELNELQDILHEFGADTREFVGGYGFWGDSSFVETLGNPNEIRIRKGLVLTGDSVLIIPDDVILDTGDGLTTPLLSRTDDVYLQVAVQEADRLDYPDIVNPDTGQELALRIQYVTTFGVAEGGVYPTIPAGDQFILFARLNRGAGNATVLVGEIEDLRADYSQTFIDGTDANAFRLTFTGGLGFTKEASIARVYSTIYSIASGAHTLSDNSLNFVYVSAAGIFTISTTRPTGKFLELYRITTASGLVINTEDRRRFIPGGLGGIILAEVIQARGTMPFLDDRLDVSLNENGTLRGGSVPLSALGDLYPYVNSPASMQILVASGKGSYGTEALEYAGGLSPIFTAPTTNPKIDLLYLTDTGTLAIFPGVEAVSPTAPSHSGKLPIAEISLVPAQTTISSGNIRDVRPLFNLGGGAGGGGSALERLSAILRHSVYERALIDPLDDDADVDGTSTGTFLGPSEYVLAAGEFLQSSFAAAPTSAPATIHQVTAVILTREDLGVGDLTVEVNRGGGFETTTGNFETHVFTGGGTNVLNIRVTNASGSDVTVEGWSLGYKNIGGYGGEISQDSFAGSLEEIEIQDFVASPSVSYPAAPVGSVVPGTLVSCINFLDGVDARISASSVRMPPHFDPTYGIDLIVRYAITAASPTNSFQAVYFTQASTPAIAPAPVGTTFLITPTLAAGSVEEAVVQIHAPNTVDAGAEVATWFGRQGSVGGDTHTGTLELIGLSLRFARKGA